MSCLPSPGHRTLVENLLEVDFDVVELAPILGVSLSVVDVDVYVRRLLQVAFLVHLVEMTGSGAQLWVGLFLRRVHSGYVRGGSSRLESGNESAWTVSVWP